MFSFKIKSFRTTVIKTGLLFVLELICFDSYAQTGIVCAGGEAGNSSYSVGLVAFTYLPGTTTNVTQGVQHAFVEVETAVEEIPEETSFQVSIFPNPTRGFITLHVSDFDELKNLNCVIFSSNGVYVGSGIVDQHRTQIDLSQHPAGVFFLHLYTGTTSVGVFKIVKN